MKLHTKQEVILPETLALLCQLQADEEFKDFFLVGGTALALQIGHRLSIDLDLFSQIPFELEPLIEHLVATYGFAVAAQSKNTVLGFVDTIKVDLITHAYPMVQPLVETEGVRLASLLDIGAMKLNVIAKSGERFKDFIDVYYLLERYCLQDLLDAYSSKYAHSNPMIALKAISYFEDIDFAIDPPVMVNPIKPKEIKNRIISAIENPGKRFR